MLQQQPSKIVTDPTRYLTCIHGGAGIGKTSFCQQIPGHYFMITEAGTSGVSVYGDPILSWEEFIEKCNEIVEAKQRGWKDKDGHALREIKVIIVDTYENLYAYAAAWVCKNYTFPEKGVHRKYSRIEDVPFGKGYARTNELLIEKLNKLRLLGFGVFVTSHTKERMKKWAGQELTFLSINLPPTGVLGIFGACDAVAYFYREEKIQRDPESKMVVSIEEGRFMRWQPTFTIDAKHRLEYFPDVLRLPIREGYQTYLSAFQKIVKERVE